MPLRKKGFARDFVTLLGSNLTSPYALNRNWKALIHSKLFEPVVPRIGFHKMDKLLCLFEEIGYLFLPFLFILLNKIGNFDAYPSYVKFSFSQ